ncbi:MAG: MBL fold metallo-hydrolase [Clostridiales bacterium]|jgi:glyoxylase-like metal-dependent hydrolase (beta-lactamase superfamily II)|nr:MBL fold metallo-hydrolase [Clostridiales bacterium]
MYELIKAAGNTYYIDTPAKIGVYAEDGVVTLIDSGNDQTAGRKIKQLLDANGWQLKRILNTHAHADHIGGNAFLQKRTNCEILCTPLENAIIRHPQLEPACLYGGYPPGQLRGKFLMAEASIPTGDVRAAMPDGFEMIPLPGHYFDMAGFRTPDDVVFLADCVTSEEILNKYHVNFLYDAGAFLDTLAYITTLEAALFIPSHAAPTRDIAPLARANHKNAQEIIALILMMCYTPKSEEELLQGVFDHFGLEMNFSQFALVGSTLRSYIAYLIDKGGLQPLFEGNRLLLKAAQ